MKKKCGLLKKSSILHQKLTENKQNELMDMLHKYQLWDYHNDEYFQYDLSTCLADLSSALEESQEFSKDLIDQFVIADEVNGDPEIKTDVDGEYKTEKEETKKEKEKEKDSVPETKGYVPHPNRRFSVIPKVAGKKEVEKTEKDLDSNGKKRI